MKINKEILIEINNRCKGVYPDGKSVTFNDWCKCILGIERDRTITNNGLLLAVRKIFGKNRKKIITFSNHFGDIQIPVYENEIKELAVPYVMPENSECFGVQHIKVESKRDSKDAKCSPIYLNPNVEIIINQYRETLDRMLSELDEPTYEHQEYQYESPFGKIIIKI